MSGCEILQFGSGFGGGSGGGTVSGFTDGSVIFADAAGSLTEDNANFFFNDSNTSNPLLGIGTTSPVASLHLHNAHGFPPSMQLTTSITGATGSDGFSFGINGNGSATFMGWEDQPMDFGTNGSVVARINHVGRLILGNVNEGFSFFTNDDQKFLINNEITSIGTSFFPVFDVIKILSATSASFNPSADTNSGSAGITIYAAQGFTANIDGVNNVNGGLPVGGSQPPGFPPISLLGAFGQVQANTSSGTIDGMVGVLCTTAHASSTSTSIVNYMWGGDFSVLSDGSGTGTLPGGAINNAIGGRFTVWASGVPITTASAGQFFEPDIFDPGTGVPPPATPTNRTAVDCRGTISVLESTVASAASITGMPAATSVVYLTGVTATTIHGIAADTFNKHLWIINQTGANLTIKNQSVTEGTAVNRIITATGLDQVTVGNGAVHLYWSTNASRWVVLNVEA